MNSSIYIFGELANGYSQYPEDSSSSLFRDIQKQCVASSQLIIHRDDNMMYYIYVRKLDKGKYIGFAIAINGYYFTQFEPLFSLFEKEIEKLIEGGVIVNLSSNGEITTNLPFLRSEEEEVVSVINSIHNKVNRIRNIKKLPPVDFSVAISSRKLFKDTDTAYEIANASYRFGFTIVLKESDYDTVRTTSFKNIIKNLNADKNVLIKENQELKEQNKKILQQKRQFKNVVILFMIVLGCVIGIFCLNKNLNETQNNLDTAKVKIIERDSVIVSKLNKISGLRDSVRSLEFNLDREIKAKQEAQGYLNSVCSYSPFAVTNCDVDGNEFSFDYFCPEEKEVTVTLKAINENNNEVITNTHTITLNKGRGTKSLDLYRELDRAYYYYVVLIYNGHVVAGKRWG